MSTPRSFIVRGVPAPQGSKRAIVNRYTGKAALVESSARLMPWRADIRTAAIECMAGAPPLSGPLMAYLTFVMPRPKGHYRSGRNAAVLKESAPIYPAGKPDIDKLTRSGLDAMTGILFVDDAQVVRIVAEKIYPYPGADNPLHHGGLQAVIHAI